MFSNSSFISNLPKTKKAVFYQIEESCFSDFYEDVQGIKLTEMDARNGLFALIGLRRVRNYSKC